MSSHVAARVIALVHDTSGIPIEELRDNPLLVLNKTIDGDDAVELIEAFAKEFAVNMTHYVHAQYFGPEASNPFVAIFYAIRSLWRPWYVPLTIAELVSIAESQIWPKTLRIN